MPLPKGFLFERDRPIPPLGCIAILPCSRAMLAMQLLHSLRVIDPNGASVISDFIYPSLVHDLCARRAVPAERIEDLIVGILDEFESDGAPHGIWVDEAPDGVYLV